MDELKSYVMASMLWDPSQDPAAVRWEFLVGFYSQELAPHVRDYLDYMSDTAANATAVITPSTNNMWNWRSNGPSVHTQPDSYTRTPALG